MWTPSPSYARVPPPWKGSLARPTPAPHHPQVCCYSPAHPTTPASALAPAPAPNTSLASIAALNQLLFILCPQRLSALLDSRP